MSEEPERPEEPRGFFATVFASLAVLSAGALALVVLAGIAAVGLALAGGVVLFLLIAQLFGG